MVENPYFEALRGIPVKMDDIEKENPFLNMTVQQLIKEDRLAGQYSLEGDLYIYRPRVVLQEVVNYAGN